MVIESSNLAMEQITSADWDLFKRLQTDSKIIELCFDEPSELEIKKNFNSRLPKWNKDLNMWLCLVIKEKKSGLKIGVTGFKYESGSAEVGYLFLPEFMGKGYATESLKALLNWAYEEHQIEKYSAVVTEGNSASERVLAKCGFILSETILDSYTINGRLYADKIYLNNLSTK